MGHSYGAAVASMYAASFPSLGLVTVDNGPELLPFAELVQRVAPMLRGPGFAEAWATIENSLGLDKIPEPVQSLVRAGHRVDQDVVLGYWDPMLNTPPADLQAYIDSVGAKITVPVLAVYGNPASEGDRRRFQQWPDVRVEEHPGDGHFVHLVDPARFAESLSRFITPAQQRPEQPSAPDNSRNRPRPSGSCWVGQPVTSSTPQPQTGLLPDIRPRRRSDGLGSDRNVLFCRT